MSGDARICLGAFAGAHGVKGDALMRAFTERPESVGDYGPVETEDGARRFTLTVIRLAKPGFAIVRAPEIENREDAAALKGARVYVGRDALPALGDADEYYIEDLIGLRATTPAGETIGTIVAVHDFGGGDILEIKRPNAKPLLAPFTRAHAPSIDLRAGVIALSAEALIED